MENKTEGDNAFSSTYYMEPSSDLDEAAPSEYAYEPLKSSRSIRLLQLFGSLDKAETIRCEVTQYDRIGSQLPNYIALSYVWGDASNRVPLVLNDRPFTVTMDLHEALEHLRAVFPDTAFWIDQICINQDDAKEQGHQVLQMKHIYQGASKVVLWLGPAIHMIAQLFVFLKDFRSHLIRDNCNNIPLAQPLATALQYIIDRPYWSRVWVIQEIVAATSPQLMCGHQALLWDDLLDAVGCGLLGLNYRNPMLNNWANMKWEYHVLELSHWSNPCTLASALVSTAYCLATDERDKVYAILGLISDGAGLRIVPDYEYPPCSIYCIAISALLVDGRSIVEAIMREGVDSRIQDYEELYFHLWRTSERIPESCRNHGLRLDQLQLGQSVQPLQPGNSAECISRVTNLAPLPACNGIDCGSQAAMYDIARIITTHEKIQPATNQASNRVGGKIENRLAALSLKRWGPNTLLRRQKRQSLLRNTIRLD